VGVGVWCYCKVMVEWWLVMSWTSEVSKQQLDKGQGRLSMRIS